MKRTALSKELFYGLVHGLRKHFFPRTYGNALYSHLQQESFLREGILRRFVLPRAKRVFRENLLAVVLLGSSQVGVRKSWSSSDLDLVVVVKKPNDDQFARFESQVVGVSRRFAVVANPFLWHEKEFVKKIHGQDFLPAPREIPFQIIYGKNWIQSVLPKEVLGHRAAVRKELLASGRYEGRK